MAKKGLAALASKQINSTAQIPTPAPIDAPHEEAAPEMTATKDDVTTTPIEDRKPGRPKGEKTMPLTVRLSPDLLHELKLRAVIEHTTQTAIIDKLIRAYLNK